MANSFNIRLLLALVLLAILQGCRASNPMDPESGLDSAAERIWFGADGSSGPCEPPAASCAGFVDDRQFVDLCVEKGFQAKTCGCALRCSGKVEYAGPQHKTDAGARANATCLAERADEAEEILGAVRPGTSLSRCVESHLCQGALGACEGDDLASSVRLRALAKGGCEDRVVTPTCRDGFVDSLSCPESDIAMLSKTWTSFKSRDGAAKRCMRKVVCSDDLAGCSDEHLKQAQMVKNAVNRDGCEYWLRKFCSLGGGAW